MILRDGLRAADDTTDIEAKREALGARGPFMDYTVDDELSCAEFAKTPSGVETSDVYLTW